MLPKTMLKPQGNRRFKYAKVGRIRPSFKRFQIYIVCIFALVALLFRESILVVIGSVSSLLRKQYQKLDLKGLRTAKPLHIVTTCTNQSQGCDLNVQYGVHPDIFVTTSAYTNESHVDIQINGVGTRDHASISDPTNTPKVALLFLLSDNLIHEHIWRAFMHTAASAQLKTPPPTPPLTNPTDNYTPLHPTLDVRVHDRDIMYHRPVDTPGAPSIGTLTSTQVDWLSVSEPLRNVLSMTNASRLYHSQNLFTVYVHLPPGRALHIDSVFSGREVNKRVVALYAQHSLVDAEVELYKASLVNPLNQQFVVVSEYCVPLWPAHAMYLQLMAETKSRVDACNSTVVAKDILGRDMPTAAKHVYRWSDDMTTSHLQKYHWRMSRQQKSLQRSLLNFIVSDSHVDRLFRQHCFTYRSQKLKLCVSDEHYIPTLLASYSLENMTDCAGRLVHTYWLPHSGWSPHSYKSFGLTSELFRRLRDDGADEWPGGTTDPKCDVDESIRQANAYFNFKTALFDQQENSESVPNSPQGKPVQPEDPIGYVSQYETGGWAKVIQKLNSTNNSMALPLLPDSNLLTKTSDVQSLPYSQLLGEYTRLHQKYFANYNATPHSCALFARKFPEDSRLYALRAGVSCEGASHDVSCHLYNP